MKILHQQSSKLKPCSGRYLKFLNLKEKLPFIPTRKILIGLQRRRSRLEKNNYCAKSGRPINNADLYREFFQKTNRINCEIIKIKGHKKTRLKSNIDRLFSLVDRASRNAVREEKNSKF